MEKKGENGGMMEEDERMERWKGRAEIKVRIKEKSSGNPRGIKSEMRRVNKGSVKEDEESNLPNGDGLNLRTKRFKIRSWIPADRTWLLEGDGWRRKEGA